MQLLALPQKCTCRYAKSWPLSTRLKPHSLTNNGYLQFSFFSLNQTETTFTDQQWLPSILILLTEPDWNHIHWPTMATFNSHSSHWTRLKPHSLTNNGYLQFSFFSLNQTETTFTDQQWLPSILILLTEPDWNHIHWPTMATFNSHSSHWTRLKPHSLTNNGYLQFSFFSLNQTETTFTDQQWLPSILILLTEPDWNHIHWPTMATFNSHSSHWTRLKPHSLTNNGYLQFSFFSLNQTETTFTDQQWLPSILILLTEPDWNHIHWPTMATFNSHSSHWTRLKPHSLTNNGYLQFSFFSLNQTETTFTDEQWLPSILILLTEPDWNHIHWRTMATFNSHSSHWTRLKPHSLTNNGYLQFSVFSLNQTQSTNTDQQWLPSILTLLTEPKPCIEKYPHYHPSHTLWHIPLFILWHTTVCNRMV